MAEPEVEPENLVEHILADVQEDEVADAANNNRARLNAMNPIVNVRERLFHALFNRLALSYAQAFPKAIRRLIEFALLIMVNFTLLTEWLNANFNAKMYFTVHENVSHKQYLFT